ncbi:MAG: glyoxylate/hydroxypyruvate reductase A [Rhodobacterales bacterium]|nr:glyoxylate/hydroxypyruvate reductase A [Rhodobacterales bacterium]
MTVRALFAATEGDWADYQVCMPAAFAAAGLDVDLSPGHAPGDVDYIVFAPNGPVKDFTPYAKAKAVLSLWAGVERIVGNATLTMPLCRMVDAGLTQAMVEWVVAQVMRHHLELDDQILRQDGIWRQKRPRMAQARPVTVLGLGALGAACVKALAALGFPVTGWSRTPKEVPGLVRSCSGPAGLADALRGAEIVVLLLPLTAETENLMNAERLALLAPGAVVLNPGRGPLIDDDALIAALDAGRVGHATLDVFRVEPLPSEHQFWAHPKVTVSPHVAAFTPPETASEVIAENIRRGEAGLPFLHLVDRKRGY